MNEKRLISNTWLYALQSFHVCDVKSSCIIMQTELICSFLSFCLVLASGHGWTWLLLSFVSYDRRNSSPVSWSLIFLLLGAWFSRNVYGSMNFCLFQHDPLYVHLPVFLFLWCSILCNVCFGICSGKWSCFCVDLPSCPWCWNSSVAWFLFVRFYIWC